MSLLTIVEDVADQVGVARPSSVAGNTDPAAQRLLRMVNMVGRKLMKAYAWQALRKEQTFTTLGQEEQTSALPSDFDRFVPETFWDRTDKFLINGPAFAVEWQGLKAHAFADTTRRRFIYRGDSIFILPAPTAGNTYAFEYVSNEWAQSSGGTGQEKFEADADTGVLNEELLTLGGVYEFLLSEGQPMESAREAYMDYFKTLVGNDQPGAGVLTAGDVFGQGRHFNGVPPVNGDLSSLIL